MKLTHLILAAAVAGSAMTSVPAAAVEVVFANITSTGGLNFRWLRGTGAGNGANATFGTTASPTGNIGGAALVNFSLSGAPIPLTVINAQMVLTGSTTNDALGVTSGSFVQMVDSFSFTITTPTAFTYGQQNIAAGSTLLSGSVLNSRITGTTGGTTGALVGSTGAGSTIVFNSGPLFTFAPNSGFGFTFNLGGIVPVLANGGANTALSTFRAQLGGSFQSEPAPTFVAVPEPASWAMMIVGMGLVGFARRRRSAVVAA